MEILDKIKEIIAEQFNVGEDELKEDTTFAEDLNADSIDLVHLVMTLEDEYGIELEDDDVEKIKTIGDAVDYIEKMID